jgi:nicotinate-nucleotide pyrophosphorylase (carboxylating)
MAMNGLQGVIDALERGTGEIHVDEAGAPARAGLHRAHARLRARPPAGGGPAAGGLRCATRAPPEGATVPEAFNETLEQARARNVRDALAGTSAAATGRPCSRPQTAPCAARVLVREEAVPWARMVRRPGVQALDLAARIDWHAAEGADLQPGQVVCEIAAQARALLSAERPSLNFLQLCGHRHLHPRPRARHRGCVLEPARLRGAGHAQDAAWAAPGAEVRRARRRRRNQRLALWDGILIKENHIAAAGGVTAVLRQAQALDAGVGIQIEVETLAQLREALDAGARSILLDNFSLQAMREAVALTAGRALLEVSGGVAIGQLARDRPPRCVDRVSGCRPPHQGRARRGLLDAGARPRVPERGAARRLPPP